MSQSITWLADRRAASLIDILEKARNAITKYYTWIGGSTFNKKYNFAASGRRWVKFYIMDL